MITAKRLLSLFLISLMIFSSLPFNAFATEDVTEGEVTEVAQESLLEEPVYEKGKKYTVDGVVYSVSSSGKVTVSGYDESLPEEVVLKESLGEFSVKEIGTAAFISCNKLKSIVIPESVEIINSNAFKSAYFLEHIEIEGENTQIKHEAFHLTSFFGNDENWKNDMLVIGGYLIATRGEGDIVVGKEIHTLAQAAFGYDSKVKSVTFLNSDCLIPMISDTLPLKAIVYGTKGSTAEAYAKAFGKTFEPICLCENTVYVPVTEGFCYNGTLGYSEGYWCEKCKIYQSGHAPSTDINHIDEDEDGICDFCGADDETIITDVGAISDNSHWILKNDSELEIYGVAEFGEGYSKLKWNKLKTDGKVKSVIFKGNTERIGDSFFEGFTSIESVDLGNNVTVIGDSAFKRCTNLKEISFSPILLEIGDYAFNYAGLSALDLPESVYKLGDYAFANSKVNTISGGKGVNYFGDYVFYKCNLLTKADIAAESIKTLGTNLFAECAFLETVNVKGAISSVPAYAFYNCTRLKSVSFGRDFLAIEEYAFYNCTSLEKIPARILYNVYKYAFYNCKKITGENVNFKRSISDFAFGYCTGLKNIKLEQPNVLGERAFYKCTGLESVEICGDEIRKIDFYAFAECENLKSVTLPEKVEKLYEGAFKNCKSLVSIKLPDNISLIGTSCFEGCASLENLDIKDISIIYKRSFYGCSAFKDVVLGEKVTSVGEEAFGGIAGLSNLTVLNKNCTFGKNIVNTDVTLRGYSGSSLEEYAYNSAFDFESIDSEKILSVTLKALPLKTYYTIGKYTALELSGAEVLVTYKNGSSITIKKNFTIDLKGTDFNAEGTYTPAIIFGDFELSFEIVVCKSEDIPVVQHYLDFKEGEEFTFSTMDCDTIRFIPEETKRYYLLFENAYRITLSETGYGGFGFSSAVCYDFIAGNVYYFKVYAETGKSSVTIRETDLFDTLTLPDGTLEIRKYMGNYTELTIPAEFNGKKVTAIGEATFKDSMAVRSVIIEHGIERIEKEAFAYCYNLESLFLPDSIVSIGDLAFYSAKMKTLTIPKNLKSIGDYAFEYCSYLCDVDFSGALALETIGIGAFGNCSKLTEITLPEGVKTIGSGAFSYCGNLESATFSSSDITFGGSIFYKDAKLKNVVLPEGLKKVSNSMFRECAALESIALSESLEEIGALAFYECKKLSGISIPKNVKSIGSGAFYECDSLTLITLPDKVQTISERLFDGCDALQKVKIEAENPIIENSAFSRCIALCDLDFASAPVYIGNRAFSSCKSLKKVPLSEELTNLGSGAFQGCSVLEEIELPEGITEIYSHTFENCKNMKSFKAKSKLSLIEYQAFSGCEALTSIEIDHDGKIKTYAFENCKGLSSVTLGSNVEVGDNAFIGCSGLKELEIKAGTSLGTNALDGCSSLEKLIIRNPLVPSSNTVGVLPNSLMVYGIEGSKAEVFAKENGYQFIAIEGHSHKFSVTVEVEEKCFTPEKRTYTCECGYSYETVSAGNSHRYKDFEVDVEPYCTTPGVKTRHCYCGKMRSDVTVIEPLGHIEVIDIPAIAPTETEAGYTNLSHCSRCGETVTTVQKIDHDEYDIIVDEGVVTAEKTDVATEEIDGQHIFITFAVRNNVLASAVDKTVIYKVGEVRLSKTRFVYNGKVRKPTVSAENSKGEPLVLNKDYKVTYTSEAKYPGNYTLKVQFIGNYAGNKTLYYEIYIEPIFASVYDSTKNEVELIWQKGHSDLTYRVYYVGDNGSYQKIADTKSGSYTVSSLNADSDYKFYVRAFVEDSSGKLYWSEIDERYILSAETQPDSCDCNCHKKGLAGVIWKILRVIYKILSLNRKCECGAMHW